MEKENSGIFFCFEKWGVMIELQHKWFHDKKTPYDFVKSDHLQVEWFRCAPEKKKLTWGTPFEIGKNMYKSPIFGGVPAVSL